MGFLIFDVNKCALIYFKKKLYIYIFELNLNSINNESVYITDGTSKIKKKNSGGVTNTRKKLSGIIGTDYLNWYKLPLLIWCEQGRPTMFA